MSKIAVLGAGMVGSAMAIDLAKNHEVTSIDINGEALSKLSATNGSITTIKSDLIDVSNYHKLLFPFDYVVTAVPGFMGYKTLEAVIKANKNVVDISFSPENCMELDALAKENGITAIIDCGVAPGISNLVLGYYNDRMQVENFECMVGGLPKLRIKPFEYKAPFSPADVIEEYTRPARFIENGQMVTRSALSDSEMIDFENVGTLESFNTDGLRSILFTMPHIPNMKEKTLRYPGHIDIIKAFIKGGFFDQNKIKYKEIELSPLQFSSAILFKQWKLESEEEEFTIMRIKISGKVGGMPKTIIYDLFDLYDPDTKTSSMARTTGYTCNAALHLLISNTFNQKGIFPPELIGSNEECFNSIFDYLQQRNVKYKSTETP